MFLTVQLFILSTMCLYCWVKWMKHYKIPINFPPGPPAVPFLGVLPFIKVFTTFNLKLLKYMFLILQFIHRETSNQQSWNGKKSMEI